MVGMFRQIVGSQLHASDYVSDGIPSVMPQNIGDNKILYTGIAKITREDAERLSKYRMREGDIVYSRRGDVERRALVRKTEDGCAALDAYEFASGMSLCIRGMRLTISDTHQYGSGSCVMRMAQPCPI